MCRRINLSFCFVAGVVLSIGGCGAADPLGRQAISGTVNFQGQPLDQGVIQFTPLEERGTVGSGANIRNGRYEISADRGLPPGSYRVRIFSAEGEAVDEDELPGEIEELPAERIPPSYNVESDIEVEVSSEGPNRFDFDIE